VLLVVARATRRSWTGQRSSVSERWSTSPTSSDLLLFATPFKELFLIYAGMLNLALAGLVAICRRIDAGAVARRFTSVSATRGITPS
jgi:hypothetical protein